MFSKETFSQPKKKLIFIGNDHAAFEMKNKLKEYLEGMDGIEVTDLGCFSEESCDYPDFAREVCEKVNEHENSEGILLCGTGIGMSMAANKIRGIRAVLAQTEDYAEMGKRHNNANVLSLGARTTDMEILKKIIKKFLSTDFEKDQERHVRRVEKVNALR